MIIGIHGAALSGKDTVADYLTNQHFFTKFAFADKLKDIASVAFDVPREDFDDQEKKKSFDKRHGMTLREMLQKLGTECFRKVIYDEFWLNAMTIRLDKHKAVVSQPRAVISDIRFDNEAQLVIDRGGIVLQIDREIITDVPAHVSEDGISDNLIGRTIKNDGSIEDLFTEVDKFIKFVKSHG